ncbi:hypothetical protein G5I_02805 [Acromyrmex echinatior]|uniref:Uncharacterized protein n=1 Tax=Acromyrmex echinatior TaxID=103372 RepID=F4WB99_ACREC|nr:hypothetical protein G5I_02805 [Acromyrmex echinatior]
MSGTRLEEIAFSDIRSDIVYPMLHSVRISNIRCKPAAVLEDAEQWGSDKGVRGRLRDGGAREQEGWVLKLPNGRETRKRKGGFERARRVANRNEEPVYGFEESYEAAKCGRSQMNEKIRNGGTPSIRNKKYLQILESLG